MDSGFARLAPVLRLAGLILVFALGAGAAFGLVSCGDDNNPELLPGNTADDILSNLDTVTEAVDSGDCDGAEQAVSEIIGDIEDLDRPVSKALRRQLKQGATLLADQIEAECTPEATSETTAEPTEPTTTQETTTDQSTTSEQTTTEQTTTTTAEPPTTAPPTAPTTPTTPGPPSPPPGDGSGGVGPSKAAG